MKERVSMLFIERGQIDVLDGAFVVIDKTGVRTQIPVGSIACLMLEPGTRRPTSQTQTSTDDDDDDSLLERIKDILNAPLPGTPQVETGNETSGAPVGQPGQAAPQASEKTPEFDEDELDEAWWKQDWAAFRAHQQRDRNGLDLKQRRDQENFVAYQQQEKQRFDGHQQQEFEAFTRQQQWRLNAWKQAVARSPGQKTPPPPWYMPAGAQMMPPMPGPMGGPPPWMRPPGPRGTGAHNPPMWALKAPHCVFDIVANLI